MPNIYRIFAYGSLIHPGSLTRTVPEARNIQPAKAYGLKRVFNLASTYRYDQDHQAPICVLNAEPSEDNHELNGTCFEMDEISLENLLEREKGYIFTEIEAYYYHAPIQKFSAFYFTASDFPNYQYLANSTTQRHYLNLCLTGSSQFGEQFVEDFKNTTHFWGIDDDDKKNSIWRGEY